MGPELEDISNLLPRPHRKTKAGTANNFLLFCSGFQGVGLSLLYTSLVMSLLTEVQQVLTLLAFGNERK